GLDALPNARRLAGVAQPRRRDLHGLRRPPAAGLSAAQREEREPEREEAARQAELAAGRAAATRGLAAGGLGGLAARLALQAVVLDGGGRTRTVAVPVVEARAAGLGARTVLARERASVAGGAAHARLDLGRDDVGQRRRRVREEEGEAES